MRLFLRHRSEYSFSEPQARLVQLLRLTPGTHLGQSVVTWDIDVDRDARLKPFRDGYGNEATTLYLDGPLDRIALDVTGEVLTEDRAGLVAGAPEPLPPAYFLQQTELTRPDEALTDFALGSADAGSPQDRAHRLAAAIHERLDRRPPDPEANAAAAAVLAAGEADAQGMAHLLLAAARVAGIPARYVAGHLFRPGEPVSPAAHGWAELFVDGYGWIGFDPHEGCCPTDHYVRVAIGLDHGQAAPVAGRRIGGGVEAMAVTVEVGQGGLAQG